MDRGGRYRFCINQKNMKLYLGSQSPRRRELLGSLGFDFEVINIECDEIYPENLPASDVAAFLSELKAKAFRSLEKSEILLTADTVVVFENKILGKPKNVEEEDKFKGNLFKQFFFVIAISVVYVILIDIIGFFVSTAIYLFVTMVALKSNVKWSIVVSILFPIFLYLVFVSFLKVPVPRGFLI